MRYKLKILTELLIIVSIFISLVFLSFKVHQTHPDAYAATQDEIELDPFLRRSILGNMGKPLDSTDPISIRDIKNLKGTIWLRDAGLKSISGLEYATSIDALMINNTEVEDFSAISFLYHLKYLSLNNNRITTLPSFAKLVELESFEANGNQIYDISNITGATALNTINLEDNQITMLPELKNLNNLTSLSLRNNKITDTTPLSELQNLEILHLDHNEISTISPLVNIETLKQLTLDGNKITDLHKEKDIFLNIDMLSLSENPLTNYNFAKQFPSLTYLGLGNCGITDFSSILPHPTVIILQLFSNRISDITPLVELERNKLNVLNLSDNEIVDLKPFWNYDFPFEIFLKGNPIITEGYNQNLVILRTLFDKYPQAAFQYDLIYPSSDVAAESSNPASSDTVSQEKEDSGSFYAFIVPYAFPVLFITAVLIFVIILMIKIFKKKADRNG